jgi:outer membrane protein
MVALHFLCQTVSICNNLNKEETDMKKILLASLLTSASFYASADMLVGGDIELNVWQQEQSFTPYSREHDGGSNTAVAFEGSIEHFIPLIPNIKYSQSSVDGDYLEYTKRDFTLYYEFLDNGIVSIDGGIGITNLADGSVRATTSSTWLDFDGYVPHLYAAAEVGIPGTPFTLFAKGNGISYSDNSMLDVSFGAKYTLPLIAFDLDLQAGYRAQTFDLEGFDDLNIDVDSQTDGIFLGANIDF